MNMSIKRRRIEETVVDCVTVKHKENNDNTGPELHLENYCIPSSISTPQIIQIKSSYITCGRLRSSPFHQQILSTRYPLVLSRQHLTFKHICGVNISQNPSCPIHETCPIIKPQESISQTSTQEDTTVFFNSVQCILLNNKSYCPPSKEYSISCCGGGWIAIDGNYDRTISSLSGSFLITSDSVLSTRRNVTAIHSKLSGGIWLKHNDLLCIGPELHPPEFEYKFIIREHMNCCPYSHTQCIRQTAHATLRHITPVLSQFSNQLNSLQLKKKLGLQEEFACLICMDWIVCATTLACGHFFCRQCILQWCVQEKLECPICRSHVLHEPTRVFGLDSIVSALIPSETIDLYNQRLELVNKHIEEEKQLYQTLKACVKAYHGDNEIVPQHSFLNIQVEWNKIERQTFKQQLSNYSGIARKYFCKLIGLTPEWIELCTTKDIQQAAMNVGLRQDIQHLRSRLKLFIHFC